MQYSGKGDCVLGPVYADCVVVEANCTTMIVMGIGYILRCGSLRFVR